MSDVDSPKVLWESIKARYVGADRVKEARLQTLNSEFDRLKMHETETIDIFAGKLAGIASKSASLGEVIDESKLVKKLLKVVPRKFIHLVASLEQVLDLKTVGFEDVVGRLKAYEERIRCDDGVDEQQKVMFTRFNEGGGSSGDGRNTGGGGFGVSGGSGFRGEWMREMKHIKGKDNNRGKGFYLDRLDSGSGSGGSGLSIGSGSKAQNNNKPNNNKSKQSNFNSDSHETIGTNQVQGNAELDWNQRHL